MHEGNVIDISVVSDKLSLRLSGLDIPYGTSCVDTGGNDKRRVDLVPVKRREWRAEIPLLHLDVSEFILVIQPVCKFVLYVFLPSNWALSYIH